MSQINKGLLRLAVAIRADIAANRSRDRVIQLPTSPWDSCAQLTRQIRRAQLRAWYLAENQLLRDLRYAISSVESELTALLRNLPPAAVTESTATTNDVYRDLMALKEEFDEIDYDVRGRWLSVTTEPIRLEGIYLGPFEVRLGWSSASGANAPAYRVIAKEPHPCESRENVTHPHVMDEILCEGHSRHAIRHALAQGRFLDFFTLVAAGLRTYNAESPFVELALWYGTTCSDCGAVVDEDDRYVCQKCEETICDRCEVTCCGCSDSCCSGCITVCAVCDDNYCRGCLQACKACRASVCSGCLENNERCSNCHEKERQERISRVGAATDVAAVLPDGLGQAAVPA
jgi:hypothetical protein